MLKKFLCLCLFCLCILSCKKTKDIVKPIENDCEVLKQYLQDAAIDVSLAIDDGLDINNLISEIKNVYESFYVPYSIKNKLEEPDENGIYKEAFASSIAWILEDTIPFKNTHNTIYNKNIKKVSAYRRYAFSSGIYFEQKGDEYFVLDSSDEKILEGMKYTGDIKNICKTIKDKRILFEFIAFNEFMINESIVNLDGTDYTIAVDYYPFVSKESDIISYKQKDDTLYVSINSCITHTEKDNNFYEQTVDEICKCIDESEIIIFDLRNNQGGYLEKLYPIIGALVFGPDYLEKTEEYWNLIESLNTGSTYLNTKQVRDRKLLSSNIDLLINNLDKKYVEVNSLAIQEKNYVPDFKGKIIILQNTETCSTAELFIAALHYLLGEQVVIFGQKTAGMLDFADELDYRLPDSNLVLHLSSCDLRNLKILKNNPHWHGDTEGFYPDYWCFSDVDEEISEILP